MKKKFNDIIEVKKRRIIEKPVLDVKKRIEKEISDPDIKESKKIERKENAPLGKRRPIKIIAKIIFAIALLLLILGGFSAIYSKADVSLEPRKMAVSIAQDLKAYKNATENNINFQIMSVSFSKTVARESGGTSLKETKSSGTATIYNYGSSPQILVAGTRLEKSDGLIYKIRKNVNIPASITKNGQKTPGSIDVLADAAEAGEKYNFEIKDNSVSFTIPGLKNYPEKYKNVNAKAKTDFKGGTGSKLIVSGEEISEISLKDELLKGALQKVKSETPEGYIFFDDGYSGETLTYEQSETNKNEVQAIISIDAVLFEKKSLIERIAEDEINSEKWNGKTINLDFADISALKFKMTKKPKDLKSVEAINFNLSGSFVLKGVINEGEVKFALAGSTVEKINSVLKNFPEINKADIIIKPFWKRSIPKDMEKINIFQKLD